MRIIGGHDYYDSAMAYGHDASTVFVRNKGRRLTSRHVHDTLGLPRRRMAFSITASAEPERPISIFAHGVPTQARVDRGEARFEAMHVFIAGTLRSGVVIDVVRSFPHSTETHRIWDAEALASVVAGLGLHLHDAPSRTQDEWVGEFEGRSLKGEVSALSIADWFAPLAIPAARLGPIISERVTILSFDPKEVNWEAARRGEHWVVDGPTLGAMGFAKALAPPLAFQEIDMWTGGVIPKDGPPIVEIVDDHVKIAKHGFDHPGSFRRAKGSTK